MADSPRGRYSGAESPWRAQSRSRSLSRSRSRSRTPPRQRERSRSRSGGRTSEVVNPGNTLYVTGLSSRVTERDLEEHFSKEGKVASCFLVMEPRTRISRGFGFVTMDTVEDANRCIKYLNQSVLEGRYITVEKSRRKRPRTPTPGQYLGLAISREGPGDRYGSSRSPRRSPPRGRRDYSPRGGRDYSPRHTLSRRSRGYSPRRSPPRGSRGYSPRRSPPRVSRDYSPRGSPPRVSRDYSSRISSYEGRPRRERSYSPYDSPGRRYSRY